MVKVPAAAAEMAWVWLIGDAPIDFFSFLFDE
jgi:hypothetical protein